MFLLCIFMFLTLLAGSLHVGDEIIEINGQSASNHSVDQLQKMLVGICVCQGCSLGRTPFGLHAVSTDPLPPSRASTQLPTYSSVIILHAAPVGSVLLVSDLLQQQRLLTGPLTCADAVWGLETTSACQGWSAAPAQGWLLLQT